MATILITGAGRGIGLELAKAFIAAGDRVIAAVRDPAAAAIQLPEAQCLPVDVGSDDSVAQLKAELGQTPIDLLINNAGVIGPAQQSSMLMDFTGFLETLNINTLGPLRVTQALLPNLKRSAAPRVAIISSRMGSMSHATSDRMAYRASKAAVNKVMQCLATDLADDNIAVASLHPGWVRTDMGGAAADIAPATSAAGIKAVLDRLTVKNTGRFWNYDGSEIAW